MEQQLKEFICSMIEHAAIQLDYAIEDIELTYCDDPQCYVMGVISGYDENNNYFEKSEFMFSFTGRLVIHDTIKSLPFMEQTQEDLAALIDSIK